MAFNFKPRTEETRVNTNQTTDDERPFIVVAEQTQHKGAMFGQVSNGGGQIKLGEKHALRFIVTGGDFVTLELLEYGIKHNASTQSWNRTKTVTKKVEVLRKPKQQTGEKITINETVEKESLF